MYGGWSKRSVSPYRLSTINEQSLLDIHYSTVYLDNIFKP